ncbi:hypothetical protein KIN20_015275 [Parelaphostrongylus tenuis]|uniref:RRM domain-containing protein n=1 Tax=Parelaphostrongylus tenuis TaxID=148309 RepID=A0AAD5N422_PARTN|nr:hypothetical protein KIN20_015275 [Parelaphostrongylus tenuis]
MTTKRLFVSGIANNVAEDVIRSYFSRFGYMSEFTLPTERETGMNRGYAYITFSDDLSTSKCLEESSHKIRNRDITVTKLSDENNLATIGTLKSQRLFVSFLGVEGVTEDSLRQVFSCFGNISSIQFAKDEDGRILYYAIIKFDREEAVDSCLRVNHCVNGRSITIRKAVTKERLKLAEQYAREQAHLEEHQKHGYAGYGQAHTTAALQSCNPSPHILNNYLSQSETHEEHYCREYENYQEQAMLEYQRQLAEYHEKLRKYRDELQQYQMQRQYRNALEQATFHKAYNYNLSSQNEAGPSESHTSAEPDIVARMRNYGYSSTGQ